MNKYLWLQVTPDKYELPVAVADTAGQLAALVGVSKSTIIKCVWRVDQGICDRSVYVRVPDPECVGGVCDGI